MADLSVTFEHHRAYDGETMPPRPKNLSRIPLVQLLVNLSGVPVLPPHQPDPRGGKTICKVHDDRGRLVSVGIAYCHPKDNYVKAEGRKLALARARGALVHHTVSDRLLSEPTHTLSVKLVPESS
jgi:hypothetical protein